MGKVTIPNKVGHYEVDGIELDVFEKDIIIRTSYAKENRREREQDKPRKKETRQDDAYIGPVTGTILGKLGIDVPHR